MHVISTVVQVNKIEVGGIRGVKQPVGSVGVDTE